MKTKKETKFYHAMITIVLMAVVMFLAVVHYGADPQIPLVFGCLVAGLVAVSLGYQWEEILEGMIQGITQSLEAILILCLIGVLVGVWISCGTVPTMIYYGLSIVSAKFFLPTTVIICAVMALAIGSWGTVGTIGLAFMGIGLALEIPAPMIAGCVISGAYWGEMNSPLSDATNLTAAVVGESVFTIVRRIMKLSIVTLIITTVVYFVMGMQFGAADASQVETNLAPLLSSLQEQFKITPLALLPMVVMVVCILIKLPAIPAMLAGVVCGFIEGVFLQGASFGDLLTVGYAGYVSETGQQLLDDLLSTGGMEHMLYAISIIIIAMSFGGIMQSTGQMQALVDPLVNRLKSRGGLNNLVVGTCIAMNVILPDQYLGISVPGQMYAQEYKKRNMEKAELAQMLLAGGAVSSPLIPWNTCGIYCMSILGVAVLDYVPYAIHCLILPVAIVLLNIVSSFRKQTKVTANG